ncbi:MAG: hypothetical protein HOW97_37875 [Catenulispora sp.]|nr:hypothetical protein [Catenulispora sp.]
MTPAQNGATIHVALGQEVEAELFPWPAQPKSTDPTVLQPGVSPMYIACRPPGTSCTQPPTTFVAHARGTAQIVAHRDMCGEARRCVTPVDWTDIRITIVVG